MKNDIKLFEQQKVRTHWDVKEEKWYFSVVDVIAILSDSVNPRDYWFKMKVRVKTEDGLELSTVCRQLKMKANDGKMRETDVAQTEVLLRIIQSIQGTGLGLSLSYDIVKAHGGELSVETHEGEGTELVISLPIKFEVI